MTELLPLAALSPHPRTERRAEEGDDYRAFLASKRLESAPVGFDVSLEAINPMLFPFQRAIVQWALRRGRAALFEDCGTGKTAQQLAWAELVCKHTGGNVIILTPLAVAAQTEREGRKFGITVTVCRTQADVRPGINVTNYEMLQHFDATAFTGIVIDESSCLKAFEGIQRKAITAFGRQITYRLACTATPAPNDLIELTNHAEFLEIMTGKEIIALFFTQDGNTTHAWRLKGHATEDFWRWMASWSVALRRPSDLGFSDDGFILPPLRMHQEVVEASASDQFLFPMEALTLQERQTARRESITTRIAAVVTLVQVQTRAYNLRYEQTSNGETERLSASISSGAPRATECSNARASPKPDTRTEDRAAGVHAPISPSASREVEKDSGATRQDQCEEARAVCDEAGYPTVLPSEREGLATGESRQAQIAKAQAVWNDDRTVSGDDGVSGERLRDLRIFRPNASEVVPGRRPHPRDDDRSRSPLYQLQPRIREVPREPSTSCGGTGIPQEKWLIWCNLNAEQDGLFRAFKDAGISVVSIHGQTPHDDRIALEESWRLGGVQVMVTKPLVFGFGMNWQHCHQVAFVGLSDSYEQFYQAVRRCWRFGQTSPVDVHVITADTEGAVVANIERKERQAAAMMDSIVRHTQELSLGRAQRDEMTYAEKRVTGQNWTMLLGDSIEMLDSLESESVGLTVFSPPFPGMYAYTNSSHDIGNTANIDEMIRHFRYLVARDKLYRVVQPGRMCAIHLCQLTAMKSREGYIGLHDYRGRVIQMMIEEGWTYAGEVTIDKNPQIQATRNKERGLMFKTLATDSSLMRMALADYLIYFRKPGENRQPILSGNTKRYTPDSGWITEAEWIEWAAPVWYRQTKHYPGGIRETDVLNVRQARETGDERHLCPLQLGVCERAIKLWSAPGEVVLDPFAGIASVGHVALQLGRRFTGIELKRSYFETSLATLRAAEQIHRNGDLFEHAGLSMASG